MLTAKSTLGQGLALEAWVRYYGAKNKKNKKIKKKPGVKVRLHFEDHRGCEISVGMEIHAGIVFYTNFLINARCA